MSNDSLQSFLKAHDPARHITDARERALRERILQQALTMGPPQRLSLVEPAIAAQAMGGRFMRAWPVGGLFLLLLGFYTGQAVPAANTTTTTVAAVASADDSVYGEAYTLASNAWQTTFDTSEKGE